MRTFEARYPGVCHTCGACFYVDDDIGYDSDDQIACLACLHDDYRATQRPVRVCPECNLEHAGECDW